MSLTFNFFNVGHGDSIVVEYESSGTTVYGVIDSNTYGGTIAALDYLKRKKVSALSFVCITHPHKDHYAGMYAILKHFKDAIGAFFTYPIGDFVNRPDWRKKYFEAAKKFLVSQDDTEIANRIYELLGVYKSATDQFVAADKWTEVAVSGDGRLDAPGFSGVTIRAILPPAKIKGRIFEQFAEGKSVDVSEGERENDRSIALILEYAGRRVLLGGDGTLENWQTHKRFRASTGVEIASDIVKIPHHGSEYDCNEDVLNELFKSDGASRYAVISANGNSHPSKKIIEHLKLKGINVRCTNLLSAWKPPVDGSVDFSGVAPDVAAFIKSYPIDENKRVSPCRGDIAITIDASGSIKDDCERNVWCPCNSPLPALLTA